MKLKSKSLPNGPCHMQNAWKQENRKNPEHHVGNWGQTKTVPQTTDQYIFGKRFGVFQMFGHRFEKDFLSVKPWPNGVARRRKLKTSVYLRLRLARACVHLRWLAMTCTHFDRDQILHASQSIFSPFGHPTQVNASWVTSINLLLANEIEDSLP